MEKFCKRCIYNSLPSFEKTLKSNEVLFLESNKLKQIYRIKDGYIKITKIHYSGDEKVFDVLGKGEYVALLSLLQGNDDYIATATALTDTTVLCFDKDIVLKAYNSNKMFQENCVNCVVTRSKLFHNHLFNVSNIELEEKILSTLDLLAQKFGNVKENVIELELPFSKTILSNLIGVRRETLSRKLSEMNNNNIIEVSKNKYKFNRL
jgi:CRP/FNR family transcriptional regulator